MFSLAAKLALTLVVSAQGAAPSGLTPAASAAWRRILPQTVILYQGKVVAGRAALIDSRGYFIAHRTSVPAPNLEGKSSTGRLYRMVKSGADEPSGLVLLIAQGWSSPEIAPVRLPDESPAAGSPLLALIGPGPISSELVTADRFGVLAPSHRLVPLVEVKFESSQSLVGGALVFTHDGSFLGALNATLDPRTDAAPDLTRTLVAKPKEPQFGPSQLTVAYTVGPELLKRVIEGFRSPTHEVWRAQMGVLCKDAESGGALIETVVAGSPAEKAGLKPGDVIFQIEKSPVKNQVDFAKAMLEQSPGAKVSVAFLRKGQTSLVNLTLVKSRD